MQGVLGLKPSHTIASRRVVVWLPDLNAATYTVLPSGLTASARGVSL
jgi:hypothetical protein